MKHQHKGFKLGRTSSHRAATLAAMSTALIKHKRITTTHTKARALRMYVEPLINRAKTDTTHSRRQVFRRLQDKDAVTELFGDIATRIAERPGGYTRIIKIGRRAGDAAPMSVIELVDYNDIRPDGASGGTATKKTRRGRARGGAKGKGATAAAAAAKSEEVVDEVVEDATDVVEEVETATDEIASDDSATDDSSSTDDADNEDKPVS